MQRKNQGNDYDLRVIRRLYVDLIKLSTRIKVAIRGLSEIERAMNRPFMFNGVRYDLDHMFF